MSQLSSPWTDPSEGSLEGLIDGDVNTFWHSNWHQGAVPNGTHYFQVLMPEGDFDIIAFEYKRRPNANNQITKWSIYGTNEDYDPSSSYPSKDDCTFIANVETPFGVQNETLKSPAFSTNGFKYLRFYCEETNGQVENNVRVQKGFFHIGEFQLYPATKLDDITAAFNELIAVLDKYDALLPNLSPGTNPGQYDATAYNAVETAIQTAQEAEDNKAITSVEIKALSQAIVDAYEKLLATFIPFSSTTIPDGYYRIRSGMQYTNTVDDEVTDCYKYLYTKTETDGTINARWQTPADLSSDGAALWKITNRDGLFDIVSAATDARFNNVATSTQVTLSTESENLMAIEPQWSDVEELSFANIRVSTQEGGADKRFYLHQGEHGGGTGVSGKIVGWAPTIDNGNPQASEWVLEPVSDEEAQAVMIAYEPIKNHDVLVQQYKEILADANDKLAVALDVKSVNLITSNSQFSSPWTEPKEGSLNNLLDGDNTTFWHSNWSNGATDPHLHYLQVDLGEPIYGLYSYSFSRRNGATNDHTTQWSIYGSASEDDDSFEQLFTWTTPFGSNTESFTSEPFDFNGSRYIRIYSDATTDSRGYWHVSEVQFSKKEENPTSQFVALGSIASNLQDVIDSQAEIADADLSVDDFNALKTAYDTFIENFVDPAALREAIAQASSTADAVVVGTAPGFWPAESNAGAFKTKLEEAKAYDNAGAYTAEKSEEYIAALTSGTDDIFASAIKLQEGKWFRFRFGTEAEYEQYEWDKAAGNGIYDNGGGVKTPELFGKYAAVADLEDVEGYQAITEADVDNVALGQNLRFLDESDITNADLALFRLVNVADTAYMIQNKATGLYLKAAGTSGAVTLSVHPTLFNVRAIGYGLNVFGAKDLKGNRQSNLHAQVSGNVLVTWDVDYAGSRSGFYVEEVAEVGDYEANEFKMALLPGSVNAFCFPLSVEADGGMYDATAATTSDGTVEVKLVPIKVANGGRPFIYIYGTADEYDAENPTDLIHFTHGNQIISQSASSSLLLKGTFTAKTVGAGVIVAKENGFAVTKAETTLGANQAWIETDEAFDTAAEVTYVISDEADGIATALKNVSRGGDIYTLDGRLVGHGNLNSLRQKGTYILNGTKVVVK